MPPRSLNVSPTFGILEQVQSSTVQIAKPDSIFDKFWPLGAQFISERRYLCRP